MRIKRLELSGFKSCMERTVLDFDEGITGIVGPNGCGKSNIVDAIRWVLGEQSAKHLRGQAMGDVIFSGNEKFGPLGMAEVTVAFDNEDPPEIPEEGTQDDEGLAPSFQSLLREAPEIQLTRRLYRSGESEYRINGNTCRLRDITELFLGTGVGSKAYSIIEQGRVGHVVAAKPEELRLLIEEAAGTTLYRSRKLAAERKIDRTRDNLLRVNDIVHELERQANSLRRQARGAVRFQELKVEETEIDKAISAFKLRGIQERTATVALELNAARTREAEIKTGSAAKEQECDELRVALGRHTDTVERARQAHYEAKGELARLEQEKEFLTNRSAELHRIVAEASNELSGLEVKIGERKSEQGRAETEAGIFSTDLEAMAGQRTERREAVESLEREIHEGLEGTEQLRSEIVGKLAAEAAAANERQALTGQIRQVEGRISRLAEEAELLRSSGDTLRHELEQSQATVRRVTSQLRDAEQGKEATAAQLREALQAKAKIEACFAEMRDELSTLRSRRESLRELEESFAGFDDSVRSFMQNGGRELTGARAVLADIIKIEGGYERAVAAVLQDQLQHVVVPDSDSGAAGVTYMRERGIGRAGFIPMNPRGRSGVVAASGSYEMLVGHVEADGRYETLVSTLLENVVVVNSLEEATQSWKANGADLTFVTREGEVVEACGTVCGGSGKPVDEGILTRKAELGRLAHAVDDAEVRVRREQSALDGATVLAKRIGDELSGLDTRMHELTVERVSAEGDVELKKQAMMRADERLKAVGLESASLREELGSHRTRLTLLEATLTETSRRRNALEERLKESDSANATLQARRREAVQSLEDLKVLEAEVRQKREACVHRLTVIRTDLAELESRIEAMRRRIGRDKADLDGVTERLADPALCMDTLRASVDERGEKLKQAADNSHGAKAQLEAAERDLKSVAVKLETLREGRAKLEISLKEGELEWASLNESINERIGLDAEGLLGEVPDEEIDVAEARERLDNTRDRIRKLGTVNVGAVAELEELDSRLTELTGQRDDLEKSIEDLRGTIARLNKMSRDRFKETFDAVNGIFKETFPKLFPGGDAHLSLTDETNLLDSGVEIYVQPPGKKLGNLNLLSGGEKALTAVSLIFSLFLHKPSPFCILDEVDAPLDEANVKRFTNMVSEMSDRSQFVIITHNKRTMDSCRTLYGVTMSQPGVSRIVSVDLGQQQLEAAI